MLLIEKKSKLQIAKTRLAMIEKEEQLKKQQNELETKVKEEKALAEAKLEKNNVLTLNPL